MSDPLPPKTPDSFLEGFFDDSGRQVRTHLRVFPCRVGRGNNLEITLPFASVSTVHAELYVEGGNLLVRDLESTNGTFVNRQRVTEPTEVRNGDVIHFGENEFRLVRSAAGISGATMRVELAETDLPSRLVTGTRELEELISERSIEPHFQPVVDLETQSSVGYEALARSTHPELPFAPPELFRIAAESGQEAKLSVLCRDRGFEVGAGLPEGQALYLNTHPKELGDAEALAGTLARLRTHQPDRALFLEIHEAAVLSPAEMGELRARLQDLDIRLAYDDFGAGQARLVELLEAPPDTLKFDIAFVRDIHLASMAKHHMIETLVSMLVEQGILCLAEGVECKEEAVLCRELGFNQAQGFYFGRPRPLEKS